MNIFFSAIQCDLMILVVDVSTLLTNEDFDDQLERHMRHLFGKNLETFESVTKLIVLNKVDLIDNITRLKLISSKHNVVPLSCLKGILVTEFLDILTNTIANKYNVKYEIHFMNHWPIPL